MVTNIQDIVITGRGFLGSNLRRYFESTHGPGIRVWTAGRAGTKSSITDIAEQNGIRNFAVVLSGWSGVIASKSRDAEVQQKSLKEFELQVQEVIKIRPTLTLGFGSQIEKAGFGDPASPELSQYAKAKIQARAFFESALAESSLVGKWAYIYSVYGSGMDSSWLLPQLLRASSTGVPLAMGQGLQKWGFLHISDFCRAIDLVIQKPEMFPFEVDIGAQADHTLRDLVNQVEDILGMTCATFEKRGAPSSDSIPNLEPLRSAGWSQRVSLKEGLEELRGIYA